MFYKNEILRIWLSERRRCYSLEGTLGRCMVNIGSNRGMNSDKLAAPISTRLLDNLKVNINYADLLPDFEVNEKSNGQN